MTARILLTTSKILNLELDSTPNKRANLLPPSNLKWRQGKLWVKKTAEHEAATIPALKHQDWLTECLRRSPVQKVCLDPKLGETAVKIWADACKNAEKQVYLRILSHNQVTAHHQTPWWKLKRVMDVIAAAVLLTILSPIMLAIAVAIKVFTPGPVFFRQWRVGKRGKLFQVWKFRTMVVNAEAQHHQVMGKRSGLHKLEADPRVTAIGRWLRKYSLDELPQLFNVLRGEMSLVGPRPWALYDAFRLSDRSKQRLNALPGITGAWQIEARSRLLDLDAVTKCDLEYLHNWSLIKDLKILLITVPKVLSGFGAY